MDEINKEISNKMLDLRDGIARRYHIEFGKEKNKVMKMVGEKQNWNSNWEKIT